MSKLTTFMSVFAALLLCIGLTAQSAQAQDPAYAERNGDGEDCLQADPCSVADALAATNSSVLVRVRGDGDTTIIEEDLTFGRDLSIGVWERGVADDAKTKGTIYLEGDITVSDLVTIDPGTTLQIASHLNWNVGSGADGDLVIGSSSGAATVDLDDACELFERLTIAGDVTVTAEDDLACVLTIDFSLNVMSGTLDLEDDLGLLIFADSTTIEVGKVKLMPGVKIAGGAAISGDGLFDLAVVPEAFAASMDEDDVDTVSVVHLWPSPFPDPDNRVFEADYVAGDAYPEDNPFGEVVELIKGTGDNSEVDSLLSYFPYVNSGGFPNDSGGCFEVSGGGALDMDITKSTAAGVCISLSTVGGGGRSTNNSGSLYVTHATTFNGSFKNDASDDVLDMSAPARTEFWKLTQVTDDVEVVGPGGVVGPIIGDGDMAATAALQASDSECKPGSTGRTAGVHFFRGVTIGRDLILNDTGGTMLDADEADVVFPGRECGAVHFRGDKDPKKDGTDPTPDHLKGAATSTVVGAVEATGRSRINLGSNNFYHSLAIQDNFYANDPETGLTIGMTGAATSSERGDLCTTEYYSTPASGNRVMFTGAETQKILLAKDLSIASITVNKRSGSTLVLDEGNALTASNIEVLSGTLETNGMLNAAGGTLVIDQSGGSVGRIARGIGAIAYTAAAAAPTTVRYTGNRSQDSGDELGVASGAVSLKELEIAKADGKDVTLMHGVKVGRLVLTSGDLLVGESTVTNTLAFNAGASIEIGNGSLDAPDDSDFAGSVKYDAKGHNITYNGTQDRATGLIWPAAATMAGATSKRVNSVTISSPDVKGCSSPIISLTGYSQVLGDLTISRGALDIAGHGLVINTKGVSEVTVGTTGYLCDQSGDVACSAPPATGRMDELTSDVINALALNRQLSTPENRAAVRTSLEALEAARADKSKNAGNGMVYFTGTKNNSVTTVDAATSKDRMTVSMPGFVVNRDGGEILLSAGSTAAGSMADVIQVPSLMVANGWVTVKESVSRLKVDEDFSLAYMDSKVSLSDRETTEGWDRQELDVGSLTHTAGTLDAMGQVVRVWGDSWHGSEVDSTGADADTVFVEATIGSGGMHEVLGDFRVGSKAKYNLGESDCRVVAVKGADPTGLHVAGDYYFDGVGDTLEVETQGLRGNVTFMGSNQSVWQSSDPDALFCDVTLASTMETGGGITITGDGAQSESGILFLRRGNIHSAGYTWHMQNTTIEESLVGRVNVALDSMGAVRLGSRESYVNGALQRAIEVGNAGGGVVTGGYLFPVGSANTDSLSRQMVDFFRPLILQFPADLGRVGQATVSYLPDMEADSLEWENIVVDASGGGSLTLDDVADMFWKVEFDAIPAHDPNIRVVADELPNAFDLTGLRLIQWNCDGSEPRLAGTYDLHSDGSIDDDSFALNDRLNGVPNLTQEGVNVTMCNIIGIASNFLDNPISAEPIQGGFARIQYIQNIAGTSVDVYVDDNKVLDDFAFQSATGFGVMAGGKHTIHIVAATDADNSNPILSEELTVYHEQRYNVIVHGDASNMSLALKDGVHAESSKDGEMEFFLVHGAPELGQVDIRLLDPTNDNAVVALLANNISFDDVGTYLNLDPGGFNFEISTSNNDRQIDVFRLELQEYRDLTFVLNLSGAGKSSAEGVTMMGVNTDGGTFFPQVITATEDDVEIPEEFALQGNYPNPFNPSTKIQFDLPEAAQVSIQIIDMLGRSVMTVPAQELEAGVNRNIEVNASRLASGTYLYRVIAIGASDTNIDTGRMVLIK